MVAIKDNQPRPTLNHRYESYRYAAMPTAYPPSEAPQWTTTSCGDLQGQFSVSAHASNPQYGLRSPNAQQYGLNQGFIQPPPQSTR